jgi:hypothetical protein
MSIFFNREFEYGGTIGKLEQDKGNHKGVYLIVLSDDFKKIEFNEVSKAGKFKGKDPTVSVDKLNEKRTVGTNILYIGESEDNVRERMKNHVKFWNGDPIRAWGGRVIGQIKNYKNLEVWYLESGTPKETEKILLSEFVAKYKKLPFANWRI